MIGKVINFFIIVSILSFYGCSIKQNVKSELDIKQTRERCLQHSSKELCDDYEIAVRNNQH